jgi:hypothetical protein
MAGPIPKGMCMGLKRISCHNGGLNLWRCKNLLLQEPKNKPHIFPAQLIRSKIAVLPSILPCLRLDNRFDIGNIKLNYIIKFQRIMRKPVLIKIKNGTIKVASPR